MDAFDYMQQNLSLSKTKVWSKTIEDNLSAEDVLKIMSAVTAGKATDTETAVMFRDLNDTTDRVTSDLDGRGNRTNVSLDET